MGIWVDFHGLRAPWLLKPLAGSTRGRGACSPGERECDKQLPGADDADVCGLQSHMAHLHAGEISAGTLPGAWGQAAASEKGWEPLK